MKIKMYKCENCGAIHSHINSYNDKYCYDCIDIETGELKKEIIEKIIKETPPHEN
jgi:predicted nucleic acid-binding Zn ribbon protein